MTYHRVHPMAAAAAAFLLASAGALTLALVPNPAAMASPAAQRATATPQPDYSKTTCVVVTETAIEPGAFLLGEDVAITRTLAGPCYGRPRPLNIVLVLDGTSSMEGAPNAELKRAARELIAEMDGVFEPSEQMAVVTFDVRGRELCPLTKDFGRIRRCINQVGARGGATIGDGLEAAEHTLATGRRAWPTLPERFFRQLIIVFSRAAAPSRCDEARRQVGPLDRQGLVLLTVCVGRDCDANCMRELATSPVYAFEAGQMAKLLRAHRWIRYGHETTFMRQLIVTETLPADTVLVAGSALPPTAAILMNPTRLVWTMNHMPSEGFTVTYRVQPRAPGYQLLSDGMHGTFRDTYGLTGAFELALPWARVLAPSALPAPRP